MSLISNLIASFPIHVYEDGADGIQQRSEEPETAYLWGRKAAPEGPNPEIPSVSFWNVITAHKVLRENAFIFVLKDNGGRPLSLWPIQPQRVRVGRVSAGRKVYEVDGYLPMVDYRDGGEIVHILGDSDDGLIGRGPLDRYLATFELATAADEYTTRFFSQDSTPSGLLSTEQALTLQQSEDLAERWEQRHAGADRARRVAVLGNGSKFQAVSFNPEETQLLQARGHQIEEIARAFGIPPPLIGHMSVSSTWGTGMLAQTSEFRRTTIQAHLGVIEATLSMAFLSGTNLYAQFNSDAILRADTKERYETHEIGIRSGFVTKDEARAREGMPPLTPEQLALLPGWAAPGAEGEGGMAETEEVRLLRERAEIAGTLVRAGYVPGDSAKVAGLPPMEHLGAPPVTVQSAKGITEPGTPDGGGQ